MHRPWRTVLGVTLTAVLVAAAFLLGRSTAPDESTPRGRDSVDGPSSAALLEERAAENAARFRSAASGTDAQGVRLLYRHSRTDGTPFVVVRTELGPEDHQRAEALDALVRDHLRRAGAGLSDGLETVLYAADGTLLRRWDTR
ncbi:hypothetical protein V1J52_10575 [Streptomyces sp. TRM 70351]|uniref:hypothetical protein n=1 Tax=Streptomyces sp. TRM 70351 TaxID=3116552 RepID=UPI002E7B284F|nr:hypothetical protein [Streptomyces sp. TRM 70351]MEE1928633.1 hypothetical protein [Streptomyces sp. TRM 70351]